MSFAMAFARRVREIPEPISEPPTGEDWEEWDKLEQKMLVIVQELNSAKEKVRVLKEEKASEDEISNAKKCLSEVLNKDMANYNQQVAWSIRFGFPNFDKLYEARESLE